MSDYWIETTDYGPLFRACDPPPSKAAGTAAKESGTIADHERRILEALQLGPAGKCEIARRSGLDQQQVARRRAGLLRAGHVELTGKTVRSDSGHGEAEWRASQDTAASR